MTDDTRRSTLPSVWRGAALVWRQDIGYTNGQDMGYTMAKTRVTVMVKT